MQPRQFLPLALVLAGHLAILLFMGSGTPRRDPIDTPPVLVTLLAPEPAVQPVPAVRPRPSASPAPHRTIAPAMPRATPAPRTSALTDPVGTSPVRAVPATPAPSAVTPATAVTPDTEPNETSSAANATTEPNLDASQVGNENPRYPALSRELGEQGSVLLSLLVRADGSVGEVKLKKSSGYDRLDRVALDKVQHWRFNPARRAGVAIDRWYDLPIRFKLNR